MRKAALLTGPHTHLDHIGVLASLLDIPLIIGEEKSFLIAKEFYPQSNSILIDWADLSLEYLSSNYDALYESGRLLAMEYLPLFQLLCNKKMRFIYCPHGNSDKGRSLTPHDAHPQQDVVLVYGQQMIDLLERTGALSHIKSIVRTGNYRYSFYHQHRIFYNELIDDMLNLPRLRTFFYAPTWQDRENPSSFFTACDALLMQLPEQNALIVKWHPLLEEAEPARIASIEERFKKHPRIRFVSRIPTIYPLLARADAYLGDHSSIGYDFLAFDKPLIFLSEKDETSPLQEAGTLVSPTHPRLFETLEKIVDQSPKALSEKRRALYAYAFGSQQPSLEEIKKALPSGRAFSHH